MTVKLIRSEINKAAYSAYGAARSADFANNKNGFVTKAELKNNGGSVKSVAQITKVFDAALKASNRTSAISPGDFYSYTKTLVAELRNVAVTKGNKDGDLDVAELKYLSAPARALAEYEHETLRPYHRMPANLPR